MTVLISVVICTYNGAQSLGQTLASLADVHVPANLPSELLVVDNGSTDQTAEVVLSSTLPNMPIRYLREPRHGKSNAYNAGIAAAQGEILLCTDDDVRLPHNWIEGMCASILSSKAQAVAGGIRLAPHLERPWMEPCHRGMLGSTETLRQASSGIRMHGANMAFLRYVFDKVPGFDTELGPGRLGLHEDTLFSMQLAEAGYAPTSAFDIVVEHYPDESVLLRSAYLERARRMGRSAAYISHHWQHKTIESPHYFLLWYTLYLTYQRIRRWKEWLKWRARQEGCPFWEFSLVEAIHSYKQYLVERKRPRNYEKHGLVKLRGAALDL